jgi:asparagine synthetase B (glutamine-hydrolysing)
VAGPNLIAFVGEILNFRELSPGAECDLSTVVEAWQDGSSAFRKFDGFWCVAAVSQITGSVHLLVDYLSQKPGYYRSDEHVIGVASEPQALAAMGPTSPNLLYFSDVIKWGYCPDQTMTPWREIKRALPGEHVTLMRDTGKVGRKIVDPLLEKHGDLKEEIELAVKRRVLSSDVPVAAMVSGGLDSAIAYTLAKRYGPIETYHVENKELPNALQVCDPIDHYLPIEGNFVSLEKQIQYMQEPIDLGSLIPQILVSDAIGDRARVCLTGDGADELFGGYSRASKYDSQLSDVHRELVCWHLPRLDRVMMRNRIEVRSPFLARRVAEIALSLPWSPDRQDKMILRHLFAHDLPEGVARRHKRALRTREVEESRTQRSRELVEALMRREWGEDLYSIKAYSRTNVASAPARSSPPARDRRPVDRLPASAAP